MNNKPIIILTLFGIVISAYLYVSVAQSKADMVKITIEEKINCSSVESYGYGYQVSSRIFKTICIYKTNLGYVFMEDSSKLDLLPGEQMEYLSYHIYSYQSVEYKKLLNTYGFND